MMIEKEKVIDNFNVLFGKISGKAKLEDQLDMLQSHIVELEIDVKRLQTRLEKRDHISKTSVSVKQELESKLNEANIKIETLMHERNEMKKEVSGHIRFRGVDTLSFLQSSKYLSQLKSIKSDQETLITAYIPQGQSLSDIKDGTIVEQIDENSQHLLDKIDSQTGYVLFYDTFNMVCEAIAPAFPIKDPMLKFGNTFDVKKLKLMANKDVGVCVVIVHAGESFVGFSPDMNGFETHHVIRSSVKAKHTKGGFSQRRFEKLRDEDIAHHIEKVRKVIKKVLEDNVNLDSNVNLDGDVNNIDYIITGGDLQLVKHVMDGLANDIPMIEKTMDIKIEKHNTDAILKSALSSRRYLL